MRKKKKQWQQPKIILFKSIEVQSGKTCGTNEASNLPPASIAKSFPGNFLTTGGACKYFKSAAAWGRDAVSTGACNGMAELCVS